MKDIDLVKTLLFTPGNRPERFAKAAATRADGVVIDLEDAVAPADKESARAATTAWLTQRTLTEAKFRVCVRVNPVRSADGLLDLLCLTALARNGHGPDAVMLPKVEKASDIEFVEGHLRQAQAAPALIALIESALGLEHAASIACAGASVGALALGGADLSADLGCAFAWEPLLWARSRVVQAAALAGIAALDVPFLDIDDSGALAIECARVRDLGFTGKLAIHPRQVETIVAAFTPSVAQIEHARGVIAAYEAAAGGVCLYKGRMIDEPVARSARRTLSRGAGALIPKST